MKNLKFVTICIFLSLFNILSCTKSDLKIESTNEISLENIKGWVNNQKKVVEKEINLSNVSIKKNILNYINWGSEYEVNINGQKCFIVEIKDTFKKINENISFKRYALFYNSNNKITMKIIELFLDGKKDDQELKSILIDILPIDSSPNNINKKLNFKAIYYDYDYKKPNSINYVNGYSMHANINSIKHKKVANSGSISTQTVMLSNCEIWGVFLITTDNNGNVISEQLLYTYTKGYCTSSTEESSPDYGGGLENDYYIQMFNNYIQMSENTNQVYIADGNNENEVYSQINWTVATGYMGSWRINAITEYSYVKSSYYEISPTLRKVNSYEFNKLNTLGSSFIGSNLFIESTWSQISKTDNILFNGTPDARGESIINGTIRHKLRLNTDFISLDVNQSVGPCKLTLIPN